VVKEARASGQVGQPKEWTCDCSSKLQVCEKRLSLEDSVLHFFVPIKAVIARSLALSILCNESDFSAQCNEVMNFLYTNTSNSYAYCLGLVVSIAS
jgi:hypothetical protein